MKTTNDNKRGGPSREWLARMGDAEAGCQVTAGGLAADLGFLGAPSFEPSIAFGKLIGFARRNRGETVEVLAKKADLDLTELLSIERGEGAPTPRSVFQLAHVLKFDAGKLMELAGLANAKDEKLREEALLFAARSEPTAKLSREEKEAFEAFVRVVSEKSGRG
jgi:transcriptional regulator with XRE-family HTH domain